MKKKLFLSGVAVLLLTIGAASFFYVHGKRTAHAALAQTSNPEADKVFRNYLVKLAGKQHAEYEEKATISNGTIDHKMIIDIPTGTYADSSTLQCSIRGNLSQEAASMNITIQYDHGNRYIKLNDIKGRVTFDSVGTVDLPELYANDLGKWYSDNSMKEAMDPAQQYGVYFLGSGMIAPHYNAQKVADSILSHKALEYTSVTQKGNEYTFKIEGHKLAYRLASNSVFYDVVGQDILVDNLFSENDNIESTLTVKSNGTFVQELPSEYNSCKQLISMFIGVDTEHMNDNIVVKSLAMPDGSLSITPATSSQDYQNMTGRQTIFKIHTGQL